MILERDLGIRMNLKKIRRLKNKYGLETQIRKQKDLQILAKASEDKELVQQAQRKITYLTTKYKQLSQISGLPTKMERLRVTGYRRINVNKM